MAIPEMAALRSIPIRLAKLEDIPRLQQLIAASVSELSAPYYTSRQIESALIHIFGIDTQLILDGTYFVAEADTEAVGCGGWSKRRSLFGGDQYRSDQIDPLLDAATEAARIRAFYVHPNWARRGIGRQILKFCEEAARSAGFKLVELCATLPGEPLYSSMGYAITEPMQLVTPDGETLPAFRMAKQLN